MPDLSLSQKLRAKVINVTITNVCNLTCGGCEQLIGHFPKEKLFFLPLDEIRSHIERAIAAARADWEQSWFNPRERYIAIYGGEPTLHPQYEELLQMLSTDFAEWTFMIMTNGRPQPVHPQEPDGPTMKSLPKGRTQYRNLIWRSDPKTEGLHYEPTLLAPIDVIGNPDPAFYFELAKENCVNWLNCATALYRDKAYMCDNAAAMDWLFYDGQFGWPLGPADQHPMMRTDEEIGEQAKHFCYRCHYCLGGHGNTLGADGKPLQQPIANKSLVTQTNAGGIRPGSGQLVQLAVWQPPKDDEN